MNTQPILRSVEETFTARYVAALVVGTLGVVLFAVQDPPLALVFVLLPVSIFVGGCAVLAAARVDKSVAVERRGRRVLLLLFFLTLGTFLFSSGDWIHTLWSIQIPLSGLLLGAGLMLVRVWPEDRGSQVSFPHGWNAATVVLFALLLLGLLPVLLAVLPVEPYPAGRPAVSPIVALFEVACYGFGGEVPSTMQPHRSGEIERVLGGPPRFVNATMGATMFASIGWTIFVALALVGRMIPAGGVRRSFYLVTPVLLAITTLPLNLGGTLDRAIWHTQPWLVEAYGPTLLVSWGAAATFFLALRCDERRSHSGG